MLFPTITLTQSLKHLSYVTAITLTMAPHPLRNIYRDPSAGTNAPGPVRPSVPSSGVEVGEKNSWTRGGALLKKD